MLVGTSERLVSWMRRQQHAFASRRRAEAPHCCLMWPTVRSAADAVSAQRGQGLTDSPQHSAALQRCTSAEPHHVFRQVCRQVRGLIVTAINSLIRKQDQLRINFYLRGHIRLEGGNRRAC